MSQNSTNTSSIVHRRTSSAVAGLIASGLVAIGAITALIIASLLDKLISTSLQTDTGKAMLDALQRGVLGLGDHAAEKMFAVTMAIMMAYVFISVWRKSR